LDMAGVLFLMCVARALLPAQSVPALQAARAGVPAPHYSVYRPLLAM